MHIYRRCQVVMIFNTMAPNKTIPASTDFTQYWLVRDSLILRNKPWKI